MLSGTRVRLGKAVKYASRTAGAVGEFARVALSAPPPLFPPPPIPPPPPRAAAHAAALGKGTIGSGQPAPVVEEADVKSYGVQAGGATRAQIEAALDDALRKSASAGGRSYCVGAAHDGTLAVAQGGHGARRRLAIVACSTISGGMFVSPSAWKRHGRDEAAAIAHECLTRGVIRYGDLEFLSEGRYQLCGAERDARNTIQRLGGWYVLGMGRGQEIMLAPASAARDFVAPQSFYVGPLGAWTVSRLHSCRVSNPDYTEAAGDPPASGTGGREGVPGRHAGAAAERRRRQGEDGGGPRPRRAAISPAAMLLYDAIAYMTRRHGTFSADPKRCLLQLENAVEDAAMLGALVRRGGRHRMYVAMDGSGRLYAAPADSLVVGSLAESVPVDPDEVRAGGSDAEFAASVRAAARGAYDRMLPAYGRIK